jgi:type VI secretion system protein ImpG
MNREFLELYNRELHVLYENAKEFAEEFPGIAERLGGLIEGNMDPMITGLLEGSAFLASRVQLKIKHEFPEFTNNLLEQLVPHYLAPTPSTAIFRIEPPYAEPNLKDGMLIKAGSGAEARYVEKERRIACKFRLTSDITVWPFELTQAEYSTTPSALQALGLETALQIVSGLRITLVRRSQTNKEDEPTGKQVAKKPETWFSRCRVDELPFHIVCNEGDAVKIYEMLFGHTRSIHLRYLNEFGDPVILPLSTTNLQQVGFDDKESLFLSEGRVFRGFNTLREFFVLPAKFLAFKLTGLKDLLSRINTNQVDILFGFDQNDARLAPAVRPNCFALYAAPAVNLFEMTTARVPVRSTEHEYHVVADRTKVLDFEPHRIVKVHAHFAGSGDKTEVYPLYSAPPANVSESDAIYYTIRRSQRRRSTEEKRFAGTSGYIGTDIFMMLANHGTHDDTQVSEISVRALCSNRHLTEHLPVGKGGTDFILEEKTDLTVTCVAGPTRPTESIVTTTTSGSDAIPRGTTAWRLISLLSLNHLGITGRGAENSASSLRELLSLFVGASDNTTERRIRGILSVESRPIVRRVRQRTGTGVVRGLEVEITLDEKAFEGSGIFLFGAVLERFFVEYAPINNAVQTVIRSTDRGEVMRWPARLGQRIEL